MSNSSLAQAVILSNNVTSPRNAKIDGVAIHCMAGYMSYTGCGYWFQPSSTGASSHYGVDKDGNIGRYADEGDRTWTTSSSSIDHRTVSIEIASSNTTPYETTEAAIDSTVNLLIDICQRNDIPELKWVGEESAMFTDSQNIYVHRWVDVKTAAGTTYRKECPGDFIYNRLGEITERVNAILNPTVEEEEEEMTQERFEEMLAEALTNRATLEPATWSAEVREWAEAAGLVEGDHNGDKGYQTLLTKEIATTMLYKFNKMKGE